MKLAVNLPKLCKARGLSLAKVARAAGVPVQTLHGWQTAKGGVNLDQLKRVAAVLEVSLHHLAFGEPDPFEAPGEEILREIFSGDVRVTLHRIERRRRNST